MEIIKGNTTRRWNTSWRFGVLIWTEAIPGSLVLCRYFQEERSQEAEKVVAIIKTMKWNSSRNNRHGHRCRVTQLSKPCYRGNNHMRSIAYVQSWNFSENGWPLWNKYLWQGSSFVGGEGSFGTICVSCIRGVESGEQCSMSSRSLTFLIWFTFKWPSGQDSLLMVVEIPLQFPFQWSDFELKEKINWGNLAGRCSITMSLHGGGSCSQNSTLCSFTFIF